MGYQKPLTISKGMIIIAVVVGTAGLGAAYLFFSFQVVPPNTVAIRYSNFWGKVDLDRPYEPGRHRIGITYSFHSYPTTIQEFSFSKSSEDQAIEQCTQCVRTRSTDGLVIVLEAWVQYVIQTEHLTEIFETYGTFARLQDRLFSVIRTTINDVVSTQAGIFIYSQRIALTEDIQDTIEDRLLVYYVDVLDFGLRSIDFPDAFEDAQLEKRVAQEKIETADFERQQSIINAQQLIIEAQAIANVTIIQAQAEASAAFAVRAQLDMSNPEYLQWLYLQQLVKLNNPDIVIITGNEVPEFLIPLGNDEPVINSTMMNQ